MSDVIEIQQIRGEAPDPLVFISIQELCEPFLIKELQNTEKQFKDVQTLFDILEIASFDTLEQVLSNHESEEGLHQQYMQWTTEDGPSNEKIKEFCNFLNSKFTAGRFQIPQFIPITYLELSIKSSKGKNLGIIFTIFSSKYTTTENKQFEVKQKVLEFLKSNYTESDIIKNVDEAKPDFLDGDWEDEYDDEYEAYEATGCGGAESQVRTEIEDDIFNHLGMEDISPTVRYQEYKDKVGEEVWETIFEVYGDILDVP